MAKQKTRAARRTRKAKPDQKPTRRGQRQQSQRPSKKATCLALLERAEGASIAELQQATGWQAHSVRGFLAGTVSKMAGLTLGSTKTSGERRYHVRRMGS